MSLTYKFVQYSDSAMCEYLKLFSLAFPGKKKFSLNYLRWLYIKNPDGMAVGFDAYDKDLLVGTYICVPVLLNIKGATYRGLLSLNTAVHPLYQGIGIFSRLANLTYEWAKSNGFRYVYGVANGNSTYGFVNKLNFQLVSQLNVYIGLRDQFKIDYLLADERSEFSRVWLPKSLAWRCDNPNNQINVAKLDQAGFRIAADVGIPFVSCCTELRLDVAKYDLIKTNDLILRPINLFIGMVPNEAFHNRGCFSVPNAVKPSPLNFILRNLENPSDTISDQNILFRFIDFDSY